MKSSRSGARLAIAGLLVVTAFFSPRRVRALTDYTSPRNADVDARGAATIRIDAGSGFLKVEGRKDIDQVHVRGTARSSRRGMLDNIKLIAERRGDEVYIKADIPDEDRNFFDWQRSLDLTIEVPMSIALDVSDGSGDAEFRDTGALRFEDGSGEMTLKNIHGDVKVIDGSGSITIDGVDGSVRVDDGSGEIRGDNITGDFVVGSDGSGEIDVDRIGGDFVVEHDGSGGIRYEAVKGKIDIPDRKRRS